MLVVLKNIAIKEEVLKNKFVDWSGGLSCHVVQLYCISRNSQNIVSVQCL